MHTHYKPTVLFLNISPDYTPACAWCSIKVSPINPLVSTPRINAYNLSWKTRHERFFLHIICSSDYAGTLVKASIFFVHSGREDTQLAQSSHKSKLQTRNSASQCLQIERNSAQMHFCTYDCWRFSSTTKSGRKCGERRYSPHQLTLLWLCLIKFQAPNFIASPKLTTYSTR